LSLLLPFNPLDPAPEVLARVASALRQGRVVAYPTETLYGLGVDPFREEALDRLYVLKGRPAEMPISILVKDVAMLKEVAHDLPGPAMRLIEAFLPGPLTLVLPARPHLSQRLTAQGRHKDFRPSLDRATVRLLSRADHDYERQPHRTAECPGCAGRLVLFPGGTRLHPGHGYRARRDWFYRGGCDGRGPFNSPRGRHLREADLRGPHIG